MFKQEARKPGKIRSYHGFLASEFPSSAFLRVSWFPAQTLISVVKLCLFKASSGLRCGGRPPCLPFPKTLRQAETTAATREQYLAGQDACRTREWFTAGRDACRHMAHKKSRVIHARLRPSSALHVPHPASVRPRPG